MNILDKLENELDNLFYSPFTYRRYTVDNPSTFLKVNHTSDDIQYSLELPGVKPSDTRVNYNPETGIVKIEITKDSEGGSDYKYQFKTYTGLDKKAFVKTHEDGVLTIHVRKPEKPDSKNIEI